MCKYLRVANVFDGWIDTSDVLEMPFTDQEKIRFLLRDGDILLNEGQSRELVGRSAIYRGDPPDCCFQNTLIRFRPKPGTEAEYAQAVFQRYVATGQFAAISSQTTSVAHLGAGRFARLKMPLPPLAEQRAIAAALSDADALLAALDDLIAKKRAMKQGAMQQLLTGRTRLPGFGEPWTEKRLAEVADIVSGATPSTTNPAYWGGEIPWCTPTDITANSEKYLSTTERTITQAGIMSCPAQLLPVGALLLCSRATIGEVKIARVPVATNQGFKSLIVKHGTSNEFLYYLVLTMKPQMIERAIGSTFLEIGKRDLGDITVSMPSLEEQEAIAAVLSDMDAEIAALERRREKMRAIKQGMMQQLLTGRVRLVAMETSEGATA